MCCFHGRVLPPESSAVLRLLCACETGLVLQPHVSQSTDLWASCEIFIDWSSHVKCFSTHIYFFCGHVKTSRSLQRAAAGSCGRNTFLTLDTLFLIVPTATRWGCTDWFHPIKVGFLTSSFGGFSFSPAEAGRLCCQGWYTYSTWKQRHFIIYFRIWMKLNSTFINRFIVQAKQKEKWHFGIKLANYKFS